MVGRGVGVRAGLGTVGVWIVAVATAVAGALVAVPAGQATVAVAETPTETGTVSGTVLLPDGSPAAGVEVQVLEAESWTRPPGSTDTTAADGTYEVSGLPPGNYLFRFVEPSGDHLWSMHLGNAEWPDKIWLAGGTSVGAGEAVVVDHTLVRSGSVRGRLTLPDDVDAADLSIVAWHPRPPFGMAPRAPAQVARIRDDGTFVIPLKPGTYVLDLSHPDDLVLTEHFSATVQGTEVTRLDLTPTRTGSISGVVRVPAGHEGEDVVVMALRQEQDGRWRTVDASATVRAGEPYRLAGLTTGLHRVRFAPADWTSSLAASFWPAATHVGEAVDVPVLDGHDTAGKDGELVVGGVVTGRVDPGMGIAPGSTQVELRVDVSEDPAGPPVWEQGVASVDFAEDGTYRLVGVPTGRYRLAVVALKGILELFHPAARTVEAGADVVVVAGQKISGVDVGRPVRPRAVLRGVKVKRPKGTKRFVVRGRVVGSTMVPTGRARVVVRRNGRVVRTARPTLGDRGRFRVVLRGVARPGRHRVVVRYAGDDAHRSAAAVVRRFVVSGGRRA